MRANFSISADLPWPRGQASPHINPPTTYDSLRRHDQGNNFFEGNSLPISTLIYYEKFYKDF